MALPNNDTGGIPVTSNSIAQPDERVRAQKALELRIAGMTYAAIAESLDYADRSGPRKAVDGLLRKVEHEGVSELRQMEGHRLDRLQRAVWVNAVGGNLDAIKTVLSIMDRRAKLFGLNAPVALHVSEEMTDIEFAEKMADLLGVLGPDDLGDLARRLPGGAGRSLLATDGRAAEIGTDDTSGELAPASGPQGAVDAYADRPVGWSNIT